jgi:hypothetical protein
VTRTFRGLALATVVLLAVGACSDDKSDTDDGATTDRPTVEVTAQPQDPQLARVIIEQVFDNLSDGDWAGAWELWTSTAKTTVAKDAYVELIATCASQQGGSYEVTEVRTVDPATASVKWKRTKSTGGEETGTSTVRYQDGAWHFEPDPTALAAYKLGHCT